MTSKNIVVISGGLGVPSTSRMLGDRIAEASSEAIAKLGGSANVQVIELREYAGDIANNMVSRYASPRLQDVIDQVTEADALIAVSPVFTASVSGLFKSFLDILDPASLEGMPVIVAATGGSARHCLVLDYVMRPIFSYLKADLMPTGVFAAPEDWGNTQEEHDGGALSSRAGRAGRELALAVMAGALRASASAKPHGTGEREGLAELGATAELGVAAEQGAATVQSVADGESEFGIIGDDEDLSSDLTTRSIAPSRKDLKAEREAATMATPSFADLLASVNGNSV